MNFKERFRAKFYGKSAEVEEQKESKPEPIDELYYSYYLFGKAQGKNIWHYENWEKCEPLFQPIIDLSPDVPYIRTDQAIKHFYGKDNQYVSFDKGGVRFGKMAWNSSNNKKWTTKYADQSDWKFFSTEIAHPTRSACQKNKLNPELLIFVGNENLLDTDDPVIDQSITIHINTRLIEERDLAELEKHILKIGEELNVVIAGKMTRKDVFKYHPDSLTCTDTIWEGTYDVLNRDQNGFRSVYRKNGIEKWIDN